MSRYESSEQRIKDNVVLDFETGCWEWQLARVHNGYGVIWVAGKTVKAHRLSYKVFNGEIPDGMCVCHSCDNPACCNPEHLWLGTQSDNVADRDLKGRGNPPKGESHYRSVLNAVDVLAIVDLLEVGNFTQKAIGELFGVDRRTINQINTGSRWSHLTERGD